MYTELLTNQYIISLCENKNLHYFQKYKLIFIFILIYSGKFYFNHFVFRYYMKKSIKICYC